ncbi:NAD(P)-binding protein [Cytobacillus sp. Hm23]
MSSFPIIVQLENRNAVVVGGGKVASRKVKHLIDAGANVVVISPNINETMKTYVANRQVVWKEKTFDPSDVDNAFVVIAATDNEIVNRAVADATNCYTLLNVVDQPHLGNFTVPSILRRGKLSISVSTDGASPQLAKKIRDELTNQYDETYSHYLDFLYECRHIIKNNVKNPREKQELLLEILDPVYFSSLEMREKILSKLKAINK